MSNQPEQPDWAASPPVGAQANAADKRGWFRRHKVASGVMALLLVSVIGNAIGEEPPAATPPQTFVQTEANKPAPPAADQGQQAAQEAARKAEAEKAALAKQLAAAKAAQAQQARQMAAERAEAEAEAKKAARAAAAKQAAAAKATKAAAARRAAALAEAESESSSVSYANCTEVRAAGKAPIRRGQPGYASHLDRDNDGQGCGAD